MNRNIITKRDAANIASKQEAEWLNRWMQILLGDLKNSQMRLGDCLSAQDDAREAEYWRGCIDTTQHILALMETARERERNV